MASSLKSWRELLASPLTEDPLEGQEDDFQGNAPDKSDKRTNPDLLRVDLSERPVGQIPIESDKYPPSVGNLSGFQPGLPYFKQLGPTTWVETDWSRGRCVFDGGHAPVAPGDRIACVEHRRLMDQD
jgi:hypothetical protein